MRQGNGNGSLDEALTSRDDLPAAPDVLRARRPRKGDCLGDRTFPKRRMRAHDHDELATSLTDAEIECGRRYSRRVLQNPYTGIPLDEIFKNLAAAVLATAIQDDDVEPVWRKLVRQNRLETRPDETGFIQARADDRHYGQIAPLACLDTRD